MQVKIRELEWIVESGCSRHMTDNYKNLNFLKNSRGRSVTFADNKKVSEEVAENCSPIIGIGNVACGLFVVWAVSTVSSVIVANQRLPPLSTEPDRCERAFVGNTIGQANGVYDKPIDLQFCDYTNEKSNLKGKYLATTLMSEAKFDGADMS